MPDWQAIISSIRNDGVDLSDDSERTATGGSSFSSIWRVQSGHRKWFLKTGPLSSFDMLDAEAAGLRELHGANAVRVPQVFASGVTDAQSYLLLEWLDLGRRDHSSDAKLGELLAAQHRHTTNQFGWYRDNTIGATPQVNTGSDNWIDFYREHRLGFQFRLAGQNGYGKEIAQEGATLQERLEHFFVDYSPEPSLLHGDLWAGNYATLGSEPVIFDPAVYYGDRETDLAMTRLFGGFGEAFYEAYQRSWPLQPGHEQRLKLYQLYHVLNHLNLFGSGYLGQALALMQSLNRTARS